MLYAQQFILHPPTKIAQFHRAALLGDISELQTLLNKDGSLINAQDFLGNTALYYAIWTRNPKVMHVLWANGARFDILNIYGMTPFRLLQLDSKLQALLTICVNHNEVEMFHLAAQEGRLRSLARLLEAFPEVINSLNKNGYTALCFAVANNHIDAIQLLMQRGADPLIVPNNQFNIIEIAKLRSKGKSNTLSKYLEEIIGIPKQRLKVIQQNFHAILCQAMTKATQQGKKLLVMVGESHGHYHLYQIEKAMLEVIKAKGVQQIYGEFNRKVRYDWPIFEYARKLALKVIGVDNHPNREKATISARNALMAADLNKKRKDGLLITGMAHLHGLLEEESSRINLLRYYVLPINLVSLIAIKINHDDPCYQFPFDASKVIQLLGDHFSDDASVRKKWNDDPIEPAPVLRFLSKPCKKKKQIKRKLDEGAPKISGAQKAKMRKVS